MHYSNILKHLYIIVYILCIGNFTTILKGEIQEFSYSETTGMMGTLIVHLDSIQTSNDGECLIPIYFSEVEDVQSMNLNFKFDNEKLDINKVIKANSDIQMSSSIGDSTVSIGAFILGANLNPAQPIFYLVTHIKTDTIAADSFDLSTAQALLNGDPADIEIIGESSSLCPPPTVGIDELETDFRIYPNPTDKLLYVDFDNQQAAETMTYSVFDYSGKLLQQNNMDNPPNSSFYINTENYPLGIYLMTIHSIETGKLLAKKKIVVAR